MLYTETEDISDNSVFRYVWYGMGFQNRIRMKVG